MLSVLLLLAFTSSVARAVNVPRATELYSKSSTWGSIYYDLTNTICTAAGSMTGGGQWAAAVNSMPTKCEPNAGYKSPAQIGSNSIVAFNQNLVWADRAKWCGKEVQIFDAAGNQVQGPDGPFYIWDSCEACAADDHIDVSGLAWEDLGGGCTTDNPSGISYKVLDNNIRNWALDFPAGGAGAPSAGSGPSTIIPVAPTSSGAQVIQSVAVEGAGACTTKGQYQCSGTTLQQCNYVGAPAHLDWQTITASCANYC